MKKLLTTLLIVLSLSLSAQQPILNQIAKTVALNCYNLNSPTKATDDTLFWNNGKFSVYNMVNTKGFVIVSNYDNTEPILAYSNESAFDTAGIENIGLSDFLNETNRKINAIQAAHLPATPDIVNQWQSYLANRNPNSNRSGSVSPLLTTTWHQSSPYKDLCPYDATYNRRCVTGCVATAMAQIIRYWSYPLTGTGSHCYTSQYYGQLCANFAGTTYDYANMPNNATAPNLAVATLNYHCGVAVDMGYTPNDGSGASITAAMEAFYTYFKYKTSIQSLSQSQYTPTAWDAILQNELNNRRPMFYFGWTDTYAGHGWVCDGYDGNGLYHMNWGWGAAYNSYCNMSNLTGGGYTFVNMNGAIIGIEPLVLPSCPQPISLVTSNITQSSAAISWNGSGVSYNVKWKAASSSVWNTATTASNTYNLPNLNFGTAYEWQVQAVCGTGTSIYSVGNFTTPSPCPVPVNPYVRDLQSVMVTYEWSWQPVGIGFTLRWRQVGTTAWNTYPLNGNTLSLVTVDYVAGTAYEWQIRTECTGESSVWSTLQTFTTPGIIPPCVPDNTCNCIQPLNGKGLNNCGDTITCATCNPVIPPPPPVTYCTSSGNSSADYIKTVVVDSILSGTETIKVTPAFIPNNKARNEYWHIYIDYNQNGSFEDAGEKVLAFVTSTKNAVTKTFTVPATALNGRTKLRVQMKRDSYPLNSCGAISYGEVEDYTVNITGNLFLLEAPEEEKEGGLIIPDNKILNMYGQEVSGDLPSGVFIQNRKIIIIIY